jgi:DNA-binding SARP family transcriptional activator
MSQGIGVFTLGEFCIMDSQSGDAVELHGKVAALLALLAVDRELPRQRALSLLWEGVPEESARHSLRQALVRLKQSVAAEVMRTDRETLQAQETLWCDVIAFDEAVRLRRFEEALQLYRGAFLDSFDARSGAFEQWRTRRAASAAVQLRTVARQLIADSVAQDRLDDALRWARHWARVADEEDEAQHRVIELLGALGRRSEAIEHYELYRSELVRDQMEPLEETTALVEQIRTGAALGALTTMGRGGLRAVPRTRRFGGRKPGGPRLVRIVDGGVEAESHYLDLGSNVVGSTEGEICIPYDAEVVDDHAVFDVQQSSDGYNRLILRPREGAVFLRIHGEWPLRHNDRFRVGQQQFRLDLIDDRATP